MNHHTGLRSPQQEGRSAHQKVIRIGMNSCLLLKMVELSSKFDGQTRQRQTGHHGFFTSLRFWLCRSLSAAVALGQLKGSKHDWMN